MNKTKPQTMPPSSEIISQKTSRPVSGKVASILTAAFIATSAVAFVSFHKQPQQLDAQTREMLIKAAMNDTAKILCTDATTDLTRVQPTPKGRDKVEAYLARGCFIQITPAPL